MSTRARALVVGVILAAMNLAGLTAVAQAQPSEKPASNQDPRRPPTERQVGEPYRTDHDALAAQAQTAQDDAVERFRRGERASQEQTTTDDATQQKLAERWNYYYQATRMSPAELKARMQAQDRADTPTQPPAQAPAPVRPPEPSGQPGWLVVSLGGLAATMAVVAGLALMAARRANRRAQVGHAT
jgi:hypothetical protein